MSVHISSADVTTSAQLLQNLEEEAASLFSDIRSRMSQVQTLEQPGRQRAARTL